MRFVATTSAVHLGPGTYLRVAPEWAVGRRRERLPDHQRVSAFAAELPPPMSAGAVVLLAGRPAPVLWAEGAYAVVEIAGRAWLLSHMTPAEMALHRNSYELGSLVQEWIVRQAVDTAKLQCETLTDEVDPGKGWTTTVEVKQVPN